MRQLTKLIPCLALLALCACSTLDPSADSIVVRAEQTRDVAVATFDAFLQLEYENRELLWKVDPGIKHAADYIRLNERGWIKSLTVVIQAYKANRSAENRASLSTWLATVEEALRQAQEHLTRSEKNL